jgi:hypothetical protein
MQAGLVRLHARKHIRAHVHSHLHTRAQTRVRTHPHAREHTNTHKCVVLIAFSRQQWFRESASLLRYTDIACLVFLTSVKILFLLVM